LAFGASPPIAILTLSDVPALSERKGRGSIQSPGSSVTEELTVVLTNDVEDVELQVVHKLKIVDRIVAGMEFSKGQSLILAPMR
jgi:hypothetical protein